VERVQVTIGPDGSVSEWENPTSESDLYRVGKTVDWLVRINSRAPTIYWSGALRVKRGAKCMAAGCLSQILDADHLMPELQKNKLCNLFNLSWPSGQQIAEALGVQLEEVEIVRT